MEQLSDRINNLSESATIAMAQKSREMSAQGHDIINLSLGEPDFHTPDFIKEAAKKAIDDNYTKYMPVPGYADFRTTISEKFKRDNNLNYSEDQIVVSTGAKQSIANVVLSLINPGDEVILPAPFWVTYHEIVKMAEGKPVIIPTYVEAEFKISPEQLKDAITDKTRLMIFSSPCNPSGSVYSKDELAALAEVIKQHNQLVVISDEIYELTNFRAQHQSLAQFDNIYEQIVTINGVSKGFSMTGWRVGYLGAPKWIAAACSKMQGQFTSGTCGIAQRAAKAALEAHPNSTAYMKKAFKERRDKALEWLEEIEGIKCNIPEGAFYLFPDISAYFGKKAGDRTIGNASDLCLYLLEEGHVATVTGEAFGSPNNIRISIAASLDELKEAFGRIKTAMHKIK